MAAVTVPTFLPLPESITSEPQPTLGFTSETQENEVTRITKSLMYEKLLYSKGLNTKELAEL